MATKLQNAPASFRGGVDVIYGQRVKGRYGKELVYTGTLPEHVVEDPKEEGGEPVEYDSYPWGSNVSNALDSVAKEVGQGMTMLLVDGWVDPEKVQKAIALLF